MKIALCKSHFAGPVSGADEILVSYALALHRAGYHVQVVLLYPWADNDQYYLRLRKAGVPVSFIITHSVIFEILRWVRDLLASVLFFIFLVPRSPEFLRRIWQAVMRRMALLHQRACRRFLESTRPDVLHVFTPDDGARLLITTGHQLGIPVLYHEMGTPAHLPMLTPYYERLESVLPFCTEVAALSPRLAMEWSHRFPFLSSVSVLPLVIENSKVVDLNCQTFADPEQTIFGFAARLEEGKGPLVMVDALARVNRERPLAVARIAGSGPQLLEVKARVHDLAIRHACELVGNYSGPLARAAFMSRLDVFVLPSFAEGTPKSIIEAMAHSIPVIATTVGGIPDIIDSESGILVPPGDTAALAAAMLSLAKDSDRRKRMGAAARRRYEELFSEDTVLPLMLQTYARVTRNGHEFADAISKNATRHPWAEVAWPKYENEPRTKTANAR